MTNSSLKIFFLAICLFLSLALNTRAQATSDSIPFNSVPGFDDHPAYSEATAYAWTLGGGILLPVLGGTLFGYGEEKNSDVLWDAGALMLATGILVGPSMGEFYAGSQSQGWLSTGARTAGATLTTIGIIQNICIFDDPCPTDGDPLIVLGSLLFLASDIYSFIDTHNAVQRANEKSKPQHFGFAPELFRSSNGGLKPGVMAWAKF